MASYDVSPLTYSVLANSFGSVRENDDELVRFQMSESIFKLINRINPGQLSGYFDHKVLEYIQLEFLRRYLNELTGESITGKLCFGTNDIVNGVDAWLTIGRSRRVSIDLTSVDTISKKHHQYDVSKSIELKGLDQGKGRSGSIDGKIGRILIGIPRKVNRLSEIIIRESESVEDVATFVKELTSNNIESMQGVSFSGFNSLGKKWVQRFIKNNP